MLSAAELIAKIVSFIIEKVGGKIVGLPFDKRRKACRSLTKLYYCLECLDDVTERIVETLRDFQSDGDARALINALNNHGRDIELASNMFVELGQELYGGLEILDPALARCCDLLYVSKFDFLSYISNSIHWDRTTSPARMVLKRPHGRLLSADMEAMYKSTENALIAGDATFWPDSILYEFSTDFEDVTIGFEDDQMAAELATMILRQNQVLKEARERLRKLLKEYFEVEEILFQPDSHPFRRV